MAGKYDAVCGMYVQENFDHSGVFTSIIAAFIIVAAFIRKQ